MRILVVSDTHGHENNLERVLKKIRKPDHLIHCGDVEGHQKILREMAGCPCTFVRGNNDFFTDLQISEIVEFGKYRIYVTHGHLHGVSWDNSEVLKEARENGCNVAMYGHTHVPVLQQAVSDDGITVLNPGSLAYPRQSGRKPSYAVMEIDRFGRAHYQINYLTRSGRISFWG